MTVAATTRKAGPYTGNGITVAFPFNFKVFAGSEVVVTQTDLSSVETVKTLTTDYTVSLNADQDANPGGTVNMVVAPTTGYLLTLTSNVTQSQGVTLTNGGGFYPKVISDALDRATILIQQLAEKMGRAVLVPVSSSVTPALPSPSSGNLIGWNALATGLTNYTPVSVAPFVVSVTNGLSDDTALWNAAVASAAAAGGGVITVPPGSLSSKISSSILVTHDNIQFDLPNFTFTLTGSASFAGFDFGSTSGYTGAPTLSVNGAIYATSITLSALGTLTAGGWLMMQKDAPNNGGAGRVYTFITKVRSITGAGPYTVTLTSPLPVAFNTADSGLSLTARTMLDNVGIRGPVTIDGSAATGTTVHGVKALNLINSEFNDLRFEGCAAGAGLWAQYGHGNKFLNCDAEGSGNASFDGLFYIDQTAATIENQRVLNGTGFGIQIAGCCYSAGGNFISEGCVIGRGIKFAAALCNTFSNFQSHWSAAANGVGVSIGSCRNTFSGIQANGSVALEGLWLSDQYNIGNTFYGVIAGGNSSRDIYVGTTDTDNVFFGVKTVIAPYVGTGNTSTQFFGINGAILSGGNVANNPVVIIPATVSNQSLGIGMYAGQGSEFWLGGATSSSALWMNSPSSITWSINNASIFKVGASAWQTNVGIAPYTDYSGNIGSASLRFNYVYAARWSSVFLAGSASYANDAAAAGGGVAVGDFYRNGSAVQIRVA